jgi:lipoprotein NlpI
LPALLLIAVATLLPLPSFAAEKTAEELLKEAQAAYGRGKPADALALISKAVAAEPKNLRARYLRGRLHDEVRDFKAALADYDEALKLDPKFAQAWLDRGNAHFKLGAISNAVADYDKVIELAPRLEPQLWQRGIALYYAGRFADGVKQFESHQTVNAADVENAVWHFLCNARVIGVAKARAALIPIAGDQRVPMMELYALYAGKGDADQVHEAVRAGNPSETELRHRRFYAHLYLGLYHDATGNRAAAREHLANAAGPFRVNHFMGDVAAQHLKTLEPGQ